MASLIQRGPTYYIQYMASGKARRVSTGTESLQIAKEKLRQFESAQARGDESPLPTKTPIADVVSAYVSHIRTVKTAKSAQTDVYYLRDAFGPMCDALQVTSRKISPLAKKRPPKPGQDRRRKAAVIEANSFEQITAADIAAFISGQVKSRGLAPKTAIHEDIDHALDRLAQSLDAGRSDALQSWLKTMSRFHNYSLNNQILIAVQSPDATHVAGFHAWKKFNRLVNKGEKGIMILAPVTRPIGKVEETDGQGKKVEKTLRRLVNAKAVYVFDISQTHGDPLPELARMTGDAATHVADLKGLIESRGIELHFEDRLPGGAQGNSEGGRIGCVNGLSSADEFRTLVHELAHELLHRGERRQETTRRSRELEAESVAFVVCSAIGLDAQRCSTDYIHLYRGDKQMLFESLHFIRAVSKEILSDLVLPHKQSSTPMT